MCAPRTAQVYDGNCHSVAYIIYHFHPPKYTFHTHLQFGEALANNQRPQVVQDTDRAQHQPIKMEILVRINDGPALLQVAPASFQRFVMVTGSAFGARLLHGFLCVRVTDITSDEIFVRQCDILVFCMKHGNSMRMNMYTC